MVGVQGGAKGPSDGPEGKLNKHCHVSPPRGGSLPVGQWQLGLDTFTRLLTSRAVKELPCSGTSLSSHHGTRHAEA